MTEKRFNMIFSDIYDGSNVIVGEEIVDLLNKFADENERLKSSLEFYIGRYRKADDDRVDLFIREQDVHNDLISVKKENDELKQQLQLIIDVANKQGVIGKSQLRELEKELEE